MTEDVTGGESPGLRRDPAERLASTVVPASGVTWTAVEILHMAGVQGAADAAIATAVAASLAWGAAGRGMVPAPLPAWVAVSGGWVSAAWYLGPLAWWPAPVLTALWIIVTWAAARAARRHESVAAAREWREARENWLAVRHKWGLGGTHLLDFERTRLGELYTVSTKGTGKLASAFVSRRREELIAQEENLAPNRVQIARHGLAGRIKVSVRRTDPWAEPLLHPLATADPEVPLPPVCSILDEAPVGQDPETGDVLSVPLYDTAGGKRVSITGISRSGKGVLLDDISEVVTRARDALMVRINLSEKGYSEAASWGPSCHLTAFGPEQKSRAAAVLKVIGGIIEWRAKTYKRGQYKPKPEDPAVIVIVDESDSAAAAVKAGLNTIATKGGEFGVSYVHAGQRGTADYTSSKGRSQDDVYCTGAVRTQTEARHSAGSAAANGPDMTAYGEGKPGVWKIARLGGAQRTGRTWVFSGREDEHCAEVERIAQERAFHQPDLPPACKEYLGDTYATLLATEVFTRWAHKQDPGAYAPEPDDGAPAPEVPETAVPVAPHEPATARAALAPGTQTAVADDDPFRNLEIEVDDSTRAAFAALDEKIAAARRTQAETAALPKPPEVSADALAAHTAERWRQIGEAARIPEESRPRLMDLLGQGTTISAVAQEFGLSKPQARAWLQNIRNAGAAYVDGEKRAARWRLATPPGNGDAQ